MAEKRGPGRPTIGKDVKVLALELDSEVVSRLRGCAQLMRPHKWTMTGIVERALTEYFDGLEAKAGVSIPPPTDRKRAPKAPPQPSPHPLLKG